MRRIHMKNTAERNSICDSHKLPQQQTFHLGVYWDFFLLFVVLDWYFVSYFTSAYVFVVWFFDCISWWSYATIEYHISFLFNPWHCICYLPGNEKDACVWEPPKLICFSIQLHDVCVGLVDNFVIFHTTMNFPFVSFLFSVFFYFCYQKNHTHTHHTVELPRQWYHV